MVFDFWVSIRLKFSHNIRCKKQNMDFNGRYILQTYYSIPSRNSGHAEEMKEPLIVIEY